MLSFCPQCMFSFQFQFLSFISPPSFDIFFHSLIYLPFFLFFGYSFNFYHAHTAFHVAFKQSWNKVFKSRMHIKWKKLAKWNERKWFPLIGLRLEEKVILVINCWGIRYPNVQIGWKLKQSNQFKTKMINLFHNWNEIFLIIG